MRERMSERVKELENEIEHLNLQQQTERASIMNQQIEQVSQLNTKIMSLNRDTQELHSQIKQVEIERDVIIDQRQQLIKELEQRQEEIQDLAQVVEETEFQLQLSRDSAKQDIDRLTDEI